MVWGVTASACPVAARAQMVAPAADTAAAACRGERISGIDIHPHPPFYGTGYDRTGVIRRLRSALHATTRPEIVGHFLLLHPGDACSELRRQESERILRAQPFIASATIQPVPDGAGGVRLRVETVDELSTVAGASLHTSGQFVTLARLGNGDVSGRGLLAQSEWADGGAYRDQYAARLVDYQALGQPVQVALEGARRERGGAWGTRIAHPFFTDLQQVAWRATLGATRDFVPFLRPGAPAVSLGLSRDYRDVGGVVRIGPPGLLGLVGASVSREIDAPASTPVQVTDSGLVSDTTATALRSRYPSHRLARGNLLLGLRAVRFVPAVGFDALRGTQDLKLGVQVGTTIGRTLSVLGSDDNDVFVGSDVYAGVGSARSFAGVQVHGEGRRDRAVRRWDGMLVTGRGAWYVRMSETQTMVTSVEYGAGWRQQVPFQLALGNEDGGVRGFGDSHAAGARRLVARAEDRWYTGTFFDLADLGAAAYADVGSVMAGDAPYGVTTGPRVGVGVALMAAVPTGSKRTWRLDIAAPVSRDRDAGWSVRFTSLDRTRSFYTMPDDIRRSRELTAPTEVFNWP